jgi:hypothetical protein
MENKHGLNEAEIHFTPLCDKKSTAITNNLIGKFKTSNGFIWRFK